MLPAINAYREWWLEERGDALQQNLLEWDHDQETVVSNPVAVDGSTGPEEEGRSGFLHREGSG